jgi:hypothetical protein
MVVWKRQQEKRFSLQESSYAALNAQAFIKTRKKVSLINQVGGRIK